MKTNQAAQIFEALSSETRLEIFRLLVKHAPEGLVAGEIARYLNIPANNLSFHLKNILHANLVTMQKEGRFLRYQANIPLMLKTIAYLTAECCSKNQNKCINFREACGLDPKLFTQD